MTNTDANNNPLNSQDAPMYIAGWNYNTGGREKRMKKGEFYDLLPTGTTVDTSTVLGLPITGNVEEAPYSAANYSTVAARTDLLSKSCYTVSFTENWQGSGRTLMKITFAIPDGITAVGAQFWYKLRNSDSNILNYGTTVQNYVAFVNTTDNAVLPAGCSETIEQMGTTTESMKEYYETLDSLNSGRISYAKDSVNYTQASMSEKTFVKTVNTNDGTGYGNSGSTILSNEYTYCLSYQVTSSSVSKNIVIYDILEHEANREKVEANFGDSKWYGTLKSVDVSEIAKIKNSATGYEAYYCNPVVYYAVASDTSKKDTDFVAFARENRDTLQKTDLAFDPTTVATNGYWTTTMPEDHSMIIAIAVDCSKDTGGNDFVFQGTDAQKQLNLYLVMTAPDSLTEDQKQQPELKTYNEAVIYSKASSDTNITPLYSSSSVTMLEELDPTITKTSDPFSGKDISNPTAVGNDKELNYTLDIKNTNEYFSITDVVVEDVIADDLAVDPSKIKVYYGDDIENALLIGVSPLAKLVSTTSGATYSRKVEKTVTTTNEDGTTTETTETTTETTAGKKITLKITGEISPGDTVHFLIPTTVNAEASGSVIKNTAVITSVEGESREITSETTYHQVMANLNVSKTVEGSMGSKVKEFSFLLTVTVPATSTITMPESIAYTKTDVGGTETTGTLTEPETTVNNSERKFTFTLAHGEEIAISLPAGVEYTLAETDADSYDVTYQVEADGENVSGSTTASTTLPRDGQNIYFTNTNDGVVPTAAHTGTGPLMAVSLAAGLGLAGLSITRRRKRR